MAKPAKTKKMPPMMKKGKPAEGSPSEEAGESPALEKKEQAAMPPAKRASVNDMLAKGLGKAKPVGGDGGKPSFPPPARKAPAKGKGKY
jgi:hypothetical protein